MNFRRTFKTLAISALLAVSAISAQAQDLLARQAPVDRKMKSVDTIMLKSIAAREEMENPSSDLYQNWDNKYAHRAIELPDRYRIDLRHFCMPTPSRVITSNFGSRWGRQHKGLDIKVYIGDSIRAAFSGKVRIVRYEGGGYGKYIVIRHNNGLETIYGHLSAQLVSENQEVRVGDGTLGFKVWQPSSEWEGDFARGYMYMATAYQDYTWSNNEALNSLTQGDYPTLKEWAYTLYIKWAKEDPVSQVEVKRNNAVYKIQGNRNPYVDFPNLMEYVWGDSTEYAFDPATTVKSSEYNGGDGGDDDNTEYAIYTANFHSYDGNCTTTDITMPDEDVNVWTRSSKYGWTATGSIKNNSGTYVKHNAEGYLVTPTIDLGEYASATLSFTHELNFCTSPAEYLSVEVRCDGNVTTLSGFTWPAGTKFESVKSGDIILDASQPLKPLVFVPTVRKYHSPATEPSVCLPLNT